MTVFDNLKPEDIGDLSNVMIDYEVVNFNGEKMRYSIRVFDDDSSYVKALLSTDTMDLVKAYNNSPSRGYDNYWKRIIRKRYNKLLPENQQLAIFIHEWVETKDRDMWDYETYDGIRHYWDAPCHSRYLKATKLILEKYTLKKFIDLIRTLKRFDIMLFLTEGENNEKDYSEC